MIRLAANLSTLFKSVPLPDAFVLAAGAGFRFVEMQFPYAWPAEDLRRAAKDAGVKIVLINAPAGPLPNPAPGLAGGDRATFAASLEMALEYARALDCERLHVMVGSDLSETLVDNMRFAAARLAEQGVTLMIEALNPVSNPGYALPTLEAAEALRAAVGHPNAALQADLFHLDMTGGKALDRMLPLLDRIGHVQFAGAPARGEPNAEIHAVLQALDEAGYQGFIGAEYFPSTPERPDFSWGERYGLH